MRGEKGVVGLGGLFFVLAVGACQGSIGPYVRNIELSPEGALVFERCNVTVTDYGFATTFDYDTAACSKSVMLLPSGGAQAAAAQSTPKPADNSPPFPASGPPGAESPPSSAQSSGVVPTPASAAPPSGPPPKGTMGSMTASPSPPPPPVSSGGVCPEKMALLPAGSFSMGDRKDRVKVGRFCMDTTEVSADAYALCVKTGQCSAQGLNCAAGANYNTAGKGDHPINCVDWTQAAAYCNSQTKRLPTEEEWEWAARGGASGKTYPWGNVEPSSQACWSGFGQLSGTCPVGNYQMGASPQGIMDLAGNVWEWTSSTRDSSSTERVARGGAWSSTASNYLRASERYWTQPQFRFIYIGFRCVRGV